MSRWYNLFSLGFWIPVSIPPFFFLKWISLTQFFFIALGWLQLDFSANNLIKFTYLCTILFRASVMKPLSLLCLSVQRQEVLNAFWTCLVNWGIIVLTEEVSTSPNGSKAEKMHKSCKNIFYVILRSLIYK